MFGIFALASPHQMMRATCLRLLYAVDGGSPDTVDRYAVSINGAALALDLYCPSPQHSILLIVDLLPPFGLLCLPLTCKNVQPIFSFAAAGHGV